MEHSSTKALEGLLADLPVGIYQFDADMNVRWLNDAAATNIGLDDPVALMGRCWYDIMPALESRRAIYERVLGGEAIDFANAEVDLPHGTRYFDVRYRPLADGGMSVTSVDVTDRRVAQLRASQVNRLEALGRLAGGVAHDLNNHLTAILGSLDLARMQRPDDVDVDIESAVEGAERAADMVAQLLSFSRRRRLEPMDRALPEVIEHVADRMLGHLLGEDVKLDLDLHATTGSALLDVAAFEQVLVNLAVNGREAMPEGGVLSIRSYPTVVAAKPPAGYEGLAPGAYVVVEVSDTGEGMDAETQAHCFEPFFTTKSSMSKNTGLGLATCFSTVQQMGGFITVDSVLGQGATFRVVFERSSSEAKESSNPSPEAQLEQARQRETVLIVDDDRRVRDVVVRTLSRCGYQTLEASNAAEALLMADEDREPIDLLLTDVILPRISGPVLARRLRDLQPSLRVLYMSGFSDHPAVRAEMKNSGVAMLEKPFRSHQLAAAVRQRLRAVDARSEADV